MTELISKNLQRYFDNKDKYNTRAKEYFNNVYYIQNKEAILKKGKLYREKQRPKKEKVIKLPKVEIIKYKPDYNLSVSFD